MTNEAPRGLEPTGRTRVRRIAERGVYDRQVIYDILDEALICHVGFVDGGHPFVLPTIHVRIEDRLYLHGAKGNRMLDGITSGTGACVTVTLVDGLVLARSAFHHSMNYRSVVILARGVEIADSEDKSGILDALMEHTVPGRLRDARPPSKKELDATKIVALPIDEASAKIRTGPPVDDESDYALPVWAGVIPLSCVAGVPLPDPKLGVNIDVPPYVAGYERQNRAE
ncbi:MAG: pyridoxamine 5'-phosphate oxidase family protein [Planctomycetes bacterium]|nr:pyridoxamine 5'-phosphate oxidase family protein [Planctomycetota bacterium]